MPSTSQFSSSNSQVMLALWITVLLAFVGYSLPMPVFGPMFMSDTSIFAQQYSMQQRVILYGVVTAMFPFAQFWGCPILGVLSDRYGRKPILMLTTAIASVAHFVTGVAVLHQNLGLLIIARLVGGFVEGNVAIAQSSVADISDDNNKASRFAWINTAINTGWLVGPLLGGLFASPVFSDYFGYAAPFYAATLFCLFNCAIIAICYRETRVVAPNATASSPPYSLRRLYQHITQSELRRWYWLLAISDLAIFSYYFFFIFYLVNQFNFGPSGLSLYMIYLSVWLIIANQFSAWVLKYIDILPANILFHFVMVAGMLLFGASTNQAMFLLTIPIVALGVGGCETLMTLMLSDLTDAAHQGEVMGICRAIFVLSEVLVSIFSAWLVTYQLYALCIVGVVSAIIAGVLLVFQGRVHQYAENS